MTRRVLFQLHLWVGLILCLPLMLLGVTGSILVFEHELAELISPELRGKPAAELRPMSEVIAAARGAAPTDYRPSFISLPEEAGDPIRVRFAPGRGPGQGGAPAMPPSPADQRVVYLDAADLAVLGERAANDGILRQIFMLHANMMIRDRSGREAIGWLGVVMLALGVSGLVLWWPRRGHVAAAFTVKRGAKGLRLHRDLHGAAGIWGLLVFVIVSFSGVYLAFPQPLSGAISSLTGARDLRALGQSVKANPVRGQQPASADRVVALAREAVPDGLLRRVVLPQRPDQPYRVAFARQGQAHGTPLAVVSVDPFAEKVMLVLDPKGYGAAETFMAWQHALHAGEGLGWTWKLLVFASGFLPLLFGITGFLMWQLKRRAKRVALAVREAPAE
jgi:uncharacterized iron-regulated membrane protein